MTIENHFLHDNQEGDFPGLMVTTQTVDPATPGTNRAIFYVRGDTKDVKIRLSDGTYIFLAQAGDSDAPADSKYLIQTADAELPNAQVMGALGTGLVVNTTTTGVQSIVNTSAGLAGVISDETGSGALVFSTNPTIAAERITGVSDTQQEIVKGYSTQTTNLVEWQTNGGTPQLTFTVAGLLTITGGYVGTSFTGTGLIQTTLVTEQMRLRYDSGNYTSFTVSVGGDLTIAPSGSDTTITGTLTVSTTLSAASYAATGTAGAGYIQLFNQSVAPGTPTTAGRIFFDNSNRLSWIGTNGYVRTFDGTANTADRIYVLPNQAGTVLLATYTGAVASTGTHTITGSADAVQFTILANSVNTSDLVQFQTSGGTVQTRFSADGRMALYGNTFTDANTIIQSVGAISIVGSATQWTLHRLTPTVTITTANETSSIISVNGSLTLNQNTFNVTTANATTYQLTVTGASGTLTNGRAMNMAITNSGAGIISVATTLFISAPTNSGGGTITSYAGASINTSTVATQQTILLLGTNTIATGTNYTIDANSSTYVSRLGAALTITGSADATQLTVKDNSTQTSVSQSWQDSSGTTRFQIGPSTVASATSATLRTLYGAAQTITLTGSTNITTSAGFNFAEFGRPTYSAASALTITNAATVYIANSPLGGGAGPVTITNTYAFWVGAGTSRFDGNVTLNAGQLTISAGVNMSLATATGTKIGTATNQLLALWNATPIVQPTTAIAAATFVANTSLIANDSATWDGYTMGQVVKALRNIGALA